MTGMTTYLAADERPLEHGWTLLVTEAGRYNGPNEVHRPAARIPARVPGTVAGALTDAGLFNPEKPDPLHNKDAWYFRSLEGESAGSAILRFAGLATIAEIYVNGALCLSSDSMYEAHDMELTLSGHDELAICFRALGPHLDKRGPRARWRPQMMDHQGLRLIRTTPLGHMPGWCPEIHPVGPFRPISLIRKGSHALSGLAIRADLETGGSGRLSVAFAMHAEGADLRLTCAGHEIPLSQDDTGRWTAELVIPSVEPWWPRTHGEPKLHDAGLTIDGEPHSLGLVGFRRIAIDRGADDRGFGLVVNGQPVFCRGAVWTNADVLRLPGTAEAYAPWLMLAAEAGMNMIRIGGTMTYESADFFRLCDRLGLLVWQDFMFANFDYPIADEAFAANVARELHQLLGSIQGCPSLAVLCGGSEVYQQGAMLGLPERIWKTQFYEETLRELSTGLCPDVPYVANSPSDGAMPFSPNEGVTHYYGVGAYCRPLEDARRAEVRFAAESLAFAHVPQQATLDTHLPIAPVHDPRWKARVPRDRGASWDFEDIRDHYLEDLYKLDPARLRREDPARYLDLSRAVTGEVVSETYAEWRRAASTCKGALVWTLQDLLPGPGWGVIDSTGEPKPVWYALKRAFRPVQVNLTNEGTNGLDVHVLNETDTLLALDLDLTCLRDGAQPVVGGRRSLSLSARGTLRIPATELFGAFFDAPYAFRFGPPSHDVTVARLTDPISGKVIAEACHFPLGRDKAMHDAAIEARVEDEGGAWHLLLSTPTLAQSLHIEVDGFRPEDDWFHLAPGPIRRIALIPRDMTVGGQKPSGVITQLGSRSRIAF
ncbi:MULTISPECIES: glycosyl hydrolase 2 galactose-binding domain-containing protein [Alphaproteobacteria]|uniref:Beta-mannosidase n=2 Tax=Alphaproteobacteria TaxID=28211 RepID=A0A512HN81_9HYPH|nr:MULTISPECIES: glycoside hydrolase family 2 protein [Alphaproteobacteria]GEO86906.1 beta-mannosidase [Ciceribacter naphthalenivorans]GLR22220.1 beta-mannosidase [Ciceribacter naphthalenivorans]GLT05076.1 beta-mannosidase [Sphingomonas psychrolutea]